MHLARRLRPVAILGLAGLFSCFVTLCAPSVARAEPFAVANLQADYDSDLQIFTCSGVITGIPHRGGAIVILTFGNETAYVDCQDNGEFFFYMTVHLEQPGRATATGVFEMETTLAAVDSY